jgi:hypothetical protein
MSEEFRVRITRAYVENWLEGACRAILSTWGSDRFLQYFGGTTIEEAFRNCKEVGRDNAQRQIEKWLEEYPRGMAYYLKYL